MQFNVGMQFKHLDPEKNDEIFSMCPPSGCKWVNMKHGPVLRISNRKSILSDAGFALVVVGFGVGFYFIGEGIILYLLLGFWGFILALLIYSIIWSLCYTWVTFNEFTIKVGRGIFSPGRWQSMHLNRVKVRPAYEMENQVLYQVVLDASKVDVAELEQKDRESLLTEAREYLEKWDLELKSPLGEMVGQAMMRFMKEGREFSNESFLTSCSDDELRSIVTLSNSNQTLNIAMVRNIEQHKALCDYLNKMIRIHVSVLA